MTILPLTYLGGIEWFTRLAKGDCVIDLGENWVKQTARNRCEIMTPGGPATLTVPVHGGMGRAAGGFDGVPGSWPDEGRAAGRFDGVPGSWPYDGRAAGRFDGVAAAGGGKLKTRDVRIDNFRRWQHTHWLSMVSGYRNSPFFEHYEERFAPIYVRKFDFLIDLNLELLGVLLPALGFDFGPPASLGSVNAELGCGVQVSENYVVAAPGDLDLRGKKALRRQMDEAATKNRATGAADGAVDGVADGSADNVAEDSAGQRIEYQEYTQVFSDRIAFVPGLSIIDLLFCEGPAARAILSSGGRSAAPQTPLVS